MTNKELAKQVADLLASEDCDDSFFEMVDQFLRNRGFKFSCKQRGIFGTAISIVKE